LNIDYIYGQTPLDEDEKEGMLIKTITTRRELDEFEQQNIEKAIEWTLGKKFKAGDVFNESFVRDLHKRMYGQVWKWAGAFRKSNKNLGRDKELIGALLKQLNDNSLYWIANKAYPEDEIAIRYKHELVSIHCFPNGNGRHSRLMADVVVNCILGKPVFTWNRASINKEGESRNNYLKALRQADKGEIKPLIEFARS
jgi:Fic-DOC domain mobile mystery protein B